MNYPLTIAIPTYNRADYLARALSSLEKQVGIEKIEVLVSDNCSLDETPKILRLFQERLPNFNYLINEKNMGMSFNISQAFDKAKGDYVWVMGDDDYLLDNSLGRVLQLIRENKNIGVIFCSSNTSAERDMIIENEALIFFKQFHFWATFISSNIINKTLVKKSINPYHFNKTLLPQLNWVIPAVFRGKSNIVLNGAIFEYQANNTGGYELTKVFGLDYLNILKELTKMGIPRQVISITFKNLFKSFFPNFVFKLLYCNNDFKDGDHFKTLLTIGWHYHSYWKYVFPMYLKYFVKRALNKI